MDIKKLLDIYRKYGSDGLASELRDIDEKEKIDFLTEIGFVFRGEYEPDRVVRFDDACDFYQKQVTDLTEVINWIFGSLCDCAFIDTKKISVSSGCILHARG